MGCANRGADVDGEVRAQPFAHAAAGAPFGILQIGDLIGVQRQAAFGAEFHADVAALAPRRVDVELDRHVRLVRVGDVCGEFGVEPQRGVPSGRFGPGAACLEGLKIDRSRFLRRQGLEHRRQSRHGICPSRSKARRAARCWRRGVRQGPRRLRSRRARSPRRPCRATSAGVSAHGHGRAVAARAAGEGRHDAARIGDENARFRPRRYSIQRSPSAHSSAISASASPLAMVGDQTSSPKRTWLNTTPPRLAMPCTSLCLT